MDYIITNHLWTLILYILYIIITVLIILNIRKWLFNRWKTIFGLNIIWCSVAWVKLNEDGKKTPDYEALQKAADHIINGSEIVGDTKIFENINKENMRNIIKTLEHSKESNKYNESLRETAIKIAGVNYLLI